MTKKKAKKKGKSKKSGSKENPKELNPAKVRIDIARMVEGCALDMAKAVALAGKQGQLAPAKYLLEVGGIYPPVTDGSMQESSKEESLAETLCKRLNIPTDSIPMEEDEEPIELPPLVIKPVEEIVKEAEEELVEV